MRTTGAVRRRDTTGPTVRRLREEQGLTQGVLARKARIDRGYLCRIERGRQAAGRDTLVRIAGALGKSVSDLLGV
jgi:transcriptional regulator with XRE-family HTH domain